MGESISLSPALLRPKTVRMTTLTVTEARRNFTALLKRAASGEEIGICYGGKIFVLTPIEKDSWYAEKEYGVQKRFSGQRQNA
jgi:prevent-host-death family protein